MGTKSPSFRRSRVAELTPENAARFSRQIMLSDVGMAGQAAIAGGVAHVGGSPLAARYALRAGFARVADGDVDVDRLAPPDVVRDAAARVCVASARAVVAEVHRVLAEVG